MGTKTVIWRGHEKLLCIIITTVYLPNFIKLHEAVSVVVNYTSIKQNFKNC